MARFFDPIQAMHFLALTLPTIEENLALDEALLLDAETHGTQVLRLWEFAGTTVVLGSGGRLSEDVEEEACRRDQVAVARRSSGGGSVLLGSGCLCFSLILDCTGAPELGEIRSSYVYILERIRDALAGVAPDILCAGTSDLASRGRKFSGNSQQRKRRHLLHHGTILYHFDLALVGRYLRIPARQPDYRSQRPHVEFLMNLPVARAELERRLRNAWRADTDLSAWPKDLVQKLVAEKYGTSEWVERR